MAVTGFTFRSFKQNLPCVAHMGWLYVDGIIMALEHVVIAIVAQSHEHVLHPKNSL